MRGEELRGPAVELAGSCSAITKSEQHARYKQRRPDHDELDPGQDAAGALPPHNGAIDLLFITNKASRQHQKSYAEYPQHHAHGHMHVRSPPCGPLCPGHGDPQTS